MQLAVKAYSTGRVLAEWLLSVLFGMLRLQYAQEACLSLELLPHSLARDEGSKGRERDITHPSQPRYSYNKVEISRLSSVVMTRRGNENEKESGKHK